MLDTVAAAKAHRAHATIEQVNAELKAGPLAHMPSGRFTANAAWLTIAAIAHTLMRTTGVISAGQLAASEFARARAQNLRTKLISIPARIAHRARRLILHLPTDWKWEEPCNRLWRWSLSPPGPAAST